MKLWRSLAWLVVAAMLLLLPDVLQVNAADGYSISPTATKTITEWNVCRRVTNGHTSSKDIRTSRQSRCAGACCISIREARAQGGSGCR